MSEVRARNSSRTRQDLLDAAAALFGERGYERSTIREIGERAGADPALIARYFGNKAGLYLETLPTDDTGPALADILDPARIEETLRRVNLLGPGPVLQAVIRAHDEPSVQAAASDRVDKRLTEGLEARMREEKLQSPRLRAQLAVAALSGIALARSAGTLEELASADQEDVVRLTAAMLGSLLGP
ncbi:TetR family transcriptional regulator [Rhodococcus sp. G-MC3]|uniref:TetR/AcrR family transcriptional regulator n=1 Tax=Rhodococcus sp. G-MC3 TaxID=3046209 RepID=UPI0024BAD869|nr:TetR/AcrR family transcriptional regulator [Rhodococcus sp. G-MC3]MDJ0392530.1 TetR family transcriptional regulator [Rhodococcus sp. G-MC3]